MPKPYPRLHTLCCRARCILRFKDGSEAFLKATASNNRREFDLLRRKRGREKTSLQVLRGLAVPRLVNLSRAQIPAHLRGRETLLLAQSVAGKAHIDMAGLSPGQLVAAWLFVAEQYAAFRRHQIVYSDVKCSNICVSKNPLAVTIIDFDAAVPLIPGRRKLGDLGYTLGFEAPEVKVDVMATEASLVYQLGVLLPHMLTGHNNTSPAGAGAALKKVRRWGGEGLAKLVGDCLNPEPGLRPQNYESVLRRIAALDIPEDVRAIWQALRGPYARRLAEVGL